MTNPKFLVVSAGDIGRFRGGNGFPPRFQGRTNGDIPFFKVSDMNLAGNELFMTKSNNYINEADRKAIGAGVIPAGSIVFAKVGAAVFLERKRILSQDSCIDNNMAAFIFDSSNYDIRFLHYLFCDFKLSSLAATGALPSLNGKQLRSISLSVPPALQEQREISQALVQSDKLITELERLIVKKQAIKQSIMQQLLTGRTRLPGFTDEWREVAWADVTERRVSNGLIKGRLSSVKTPETPFPAFSASGQDVWMSTFDYSGEGVVVSAVGSRCGKAFFAYGQWSAIANTHIVLPRMGLLSARFAFLFFDDEAFWIKGGSGQPFVQMKSSLQKRVHLPPLEEQLAIVRVIWDAMSEITALGRRLETVRLIKQGMMQELLSGRTRLTPTGE